MGRHPALLLGLWLVTAPARAQPAPDRGTPVPEQAKVIELDGKRYPVPAGATLMRVETVFLGPGEQPPAGHVARGLPPRATVYRGAKVPPGATRAYSVLKFTVPNKRGMADVLEGREPEGTHDEEVLIPPAGGVEPPPEEAIPPPANVAPLPPEEEPPPVDEGPPSAATPPAQPPATPPPGGEGGGRPADTPAPTRQVLVQVDY